MYYRKLELIEKEDKFLFAVTDVPYNREKGSNEPLGLPGLIILYWPKNRSLKKGKELMIKYLEKQIKKEIAGRKQILKKLKNLEAL